MAFFNGKKDGFEQGAADAISGLTNDPTRVEHLYMNKRLPENYAIDFVTSYLDGWHGHSPAKT